MKWYLSTNNEGVDICVHIAAKNPCMVTMHTSCLDTDVVFNFRQEQIPAGNHVILMKMPFTPKNLIVKVVGSIPNNMQVTIEKRSCKSYNVPIGSFQTEFMEFSQAMAWMVMNGKISPSDKIYKSANENFKMVVLPRITNYYGRAIGSPASIDADKKIIMVDNEMIVNFTMAGMIALLCHEYAHVYENEKNGLKASSEEGADKYGLRLFLACGYGESEYINAFAKTFKRADSSENRRRIQAMFNHAKEISEGKIYGKPY